MKDNLSTPALRQHWKRSAIAAALIASVSACGWVDSTGNQPELNTVNTVETVVNTGQLLDGNQTVVVINEDTTRRVSPSPALQRAGLDATWSWVASASDSAKQFCDGINGFNATLATNNINEACSDSDNCELNITPANTNNGDTGFSIDVPPLSRPVAVNYTINAETNSSGVNAESVTLCLIAINEAPVAQDDTYTVVKGSTLRVNASDANQLLSNDYDDIDASNQPLTVNTTPLSLPQHAARIDLKADGSFLYTPSSEAPVPVNGSLIDSFDYSVTDGIFLSSARVTIRVVNQNTAPRVAARVPDLVVLANSTLSANDNRFDLSRYFSDADNDLLSYSVATDSLPPSGALRLTTAGRLVGRPTGRDRGSYNVTVSASDGSLRASASFTLFIAVNTAEVEDFSDAIETVVNDANRAPGVTDISNRTFNDDFTYDISVFFSDVDDDTLTYTATRLPPDIKLSKAGLLTGSVTDDNEGTHLIEITAEDPGGLSVSDRFRITLR